MPINKELEGLAVTEWEVQQSLRLLWRKLVGQLTPSKANYLCKY